MKHLVSIGELLIDFIPVEKGVKLKDVNGFVKYPGGAPANVAVAATKSGVKSYFLGSVGKDSFGDFLIESLKKEHVDCSYLTQNTNANTALAFVTLSSTGERDFIFYRDPSADQLYSEKDLPKEILKDCVLHFCSVSLSDYPIKQAHIKAIELVKQDKGFISFDPNLRLSLWKDHNAYKKVINDFIPKADLLKVSSDELEFITGIKDESKAIQSLFVGDVKYVILTLGKEGSTLYFKNGQNIHVPSYKVSVVDTTGAGDAFIGSFLAEMIKKDLVFSEVNVKGALSISNGKAALTTTKFGGMSSIPTQQEFEQFIQNNKGQR